MTIPAISILMPVRNAARYLRVSLDSIQKQSFQEWELVVVNDGSVDESQYLLENAAQHDSRIRVLNVPGIGLGRALQYGVVHCQGSFIARMDADDISAPTRLERQASFLINNPSVVICGTWCWIFCVELGVCAAWHFPNNDNFLRRHLVEKRSSTFVHGSVMFRREAYQKTVGYRFPLFGEDFDLWLQLSEHGRLGVLESPEYMYQVNLSSTSFVRAKQGRLVKDVAIKLYRQRQRDGREHSDYLALCAEVARRYKEVPEQYRERMKCYYIAMRLAERGERKASMLAFRRLWHIDPIGLRAAWRYVNLLLGRAPMMEDSLAITKLFNLEVLAEKEPWHWAKEYLLQVGVPNEVYDNSTKYAFSLSS